VIEKYTGLLAAADVFTGEHDVLVMESIRLDLGYGSQAAPSDVARQRRRARSQATLDGVREAGALALEADVTDPASVHALDRAGQSRSAHVAGTERVSGERSASIPPATPIVWRPKRE